MQNNDLNTCPANPGDSMTNEDVMRNVLPTVYDHEDLNSSESGSASSVGFLRSFTDEQKTFLLQHSVAVLYTPTNEHFGIVPIECMAMGRPVIAVNSGGPRESVIDEETGFLCNPEPSVRLLHWPIDKSHILSFWFDCSLSVNPCKRSFVICRLWDPWGRMVDCTFRIHSPMTLFHKDCMKYRRVFVVMNPQKGSNRSIFISGFFWPVFSSMLSSV